MLALSPVPPAAESLRFDHDGAQRFSGLLKPLLSDLLTALKHLPEQRAGVRISGLTGLQPFLTPTGPIGSVAAGALGRRCRPVRAILFDKTADANWSLAWHQDRTICVEERRDVPGFGPWTIKGGMQHVSPPFDLFSRMVTLRVHLDDVPATNAPLLIAPRSHKFGRVAESDIDRVVRACGTAACTAEAGDVWLYATPILHASDASRAPSRRRVLQLDYAAQSLPGGLEWLGV